jgi:hypothetical protein
MKPWLVHVASPQNLHLTLSVDAPTAEAAGILALWLALTACGWSAATAWPAVALREGRAA